MVCLKTRACERLAGDSARVKKLASPLESGDSGVSREFRQVPTIPAWFRQVKLRVN